MTDKQRAIRIVDGLNRYAYMGKVARHWGYLTKGGKISKHQTNEMIKFIKHNGYACTNGTWALAENRQATEEVKTTVNKMGAAEELFFTNIGIKKPTPTMRTSYKEFVDTVTAATTSVTKTAYILAIDQSQSTGGIWLAIERAVNKTINSLREANPDALVGIVTYGYPVDETTLVQDMVEVKNLGNYKHRVGYWTPLSTGIMESALELRKLTDYNKTVICFTDGQESQFTDYKPKDVKKMIEEGDVNVVYLAPSLNATLWTGDDGTTPYTVLAGIKEGNMVEFSLTNTGIESIFDKVIGSITRREEQASKGEDLPDEFFMDI